MKPTRREMLRLTAAAAATPLLPRTAGGAAPPAAPVPLPAGRFFGSAEMALLDELTETMIPADDHSGGARAAKVAAYIDARLAEYDPAIPDLATERERWKAGLASLDGLAREVTGRPFVEATAEGRDRLCSRLAANEKEPKTEAERFFVELKERTVFAYYTSSIGIHDELEYKGNSMLAEFAGADPED